MLFRSGACRDALNGLRESGDPLEAQAGRLPGEDQDRQARVVRVMVRLVLSIGWGPWGCVAVSPVEGTAPGCIIWDATSSLAALPARPQL